MKKDDQHLNSMHLEWPRRQQFRKAREALLNACGEQTRLVVLPQDSGNSQAGSKTVIVHTENRLPTGLTYGLMDQEMVYPLKVGVNTIGRMLDNEVVLEDPYVSRRHCAVVVHADEHTFELHDVASKNGTYLNGTRITGAMPLVSGDEIRLCDRQLIFVTKPGLRPPAERTPTLGK